MRRINLKFLIILTALAAVIGSGGIVAYKIQRRRSVAALLVQAKAAEKAGDHAKAEGFYTHYLGFRPDDGPTMADYGLMLAGDAKNFQDRVKALLVLSQVVRRDPGRSDIRQQIVQIAMNKTVQRYSQALEQLEALLVVSPDDAQLEFQSARCLEGERKYSEAVEMYSKATTHDSKLVDAYLQDADLLRTRLAKPAEANKLLDRMVELNPNSYRAYLERGNQRRMNGLNGADEDIAQALKLAPDEVDVLAAVAELALGKGEIDRARTLADRCLISKTTDSRFYDLSYRIELRAGRPEEAVAVLRKGVDLEPDAEDRIRLLMNLANLQVTRADYAGADQSIKRLLEEKVRPEYPRFFQARMLAAKGQWREAARTLDDIHAELTNTPQLAYDADLLLALCCERLGEQDRRAAAYNRAVALKPMDLRGRLGVAETFATSGRIEEAISQYRNIEAEIPRVRTDLARLILIRNLRRTPADRNWTEVDRALADAEATTPGAMGVQLLRAEILADHGRLDESRDALKAAARRSPKEDAPWVALATLDLRRGRQQEALTVLDQAESSGLVDSVGLRLARAEVWVARGGKEAAETLGRLAEGLDRLPEEERTRLLRGLAEAHRRLGDVAGARTIMDRLAGQAPDDLSLTLARFDLAYRSEDGVAMKSIVEAIGDKDEVTARLARARYLAWSASRGGLPPEAVRNSLDEARQLLNQVATRRPSWPPAVLAGAYIADLGGDLDGAIRGYLQAIDLGERGEDVATRAVELLSSRGRFEQADEVARKVIASDVKPSQPRFYRLAAEAAMRSKDPARALEYAARAVPPDAATPGDRLWRGRMLWAAGKTSQAEADFRSAAESAGEAVAPDAWTILVAYLASTGRRPAAEEAVDQARRKLPKRSRALTLARCFAILKKGDQAREQYQAATSASPQDMATLETAAGIALQIGRLEDAKDYLRKIVARQGDSPDSASRARRTLGVLLAGSGDRRQAGEALAVMSLVEDAIPSPPSAEVSTEDLRAKAQVLVLRGGRPNRRVAIQVLKTILERDKPSPDDRFLMALVLEADGDWPKAREQIQLALSDSGNSAAILAFYIRGLIRHEEARGARPWLDAFEKAAPSSPQVVEFKARLALAEKRPEVASRLLVDYARSQPGSILSIALMLESLGRWDDAERLFREFASREKQPEAALPLASFLGRRNRMPEALDLCDGVWKAGRVELASQTSVAILYASKLDEGASRRVSDHIEEAIRRSPEKVQLAFDLANVQIIRGDYLAAEAVFRRIYEKDKENSASANNLAWLLTLQDGKASEAITLIDRALELSGPLPMLLDTRGMARLASDQTVAAIEDLEEATNTGPTAGRYFHLALAYQKANRPKDAKEAFQEAKVLGLDEAKLHPNERKEYAKLAGESQGK